MKSFAEYVAVIVILGILFIVGGRKIASTVSTYSGQLASNITPK